MGDDRAGAGADQPPWERRFRAPQVGFPDWSPHAPDLAAYPSTESGIWQLHAWDLSSGSRRQVTDEPVGVLDGTPTLDGSGVLWFRDETGDESGRWFVQPFGGGASRPFLEGVPHGWSDGLAQAPGIVVAAVSDRDGFAVYASEEGAPARGIARSSWSLQLGGADGGGFNRAALSADGSLLCVEHAEHGDQIHPALRVLDPRTGATVSEQRDDGMALRAAAWSPVPGDRRLAIVHERDGEERPAIWDLSTGERTDLKLDLRGPVFVRDWWPDGSSLLLSNLFEGRDSLYRCRPSTGGLERLETPPGTVWGARVRPDGSVWYLHHQAHRRPVVLDDEGKVVLEPGGDAAPPGRPYVSWHFTNRHGQRVHGFYATREGSGPWPVVMYVHGGPTWLEADRWRPEIQSYLDAGFAVGMVNYRGSTGYGREWRDSLIGDVGGPELEDVNAGLADLVERGVGDPRRAVIAGWSWGGYVALLELGKHPELWACGVAGVPVADYVASWDDSSPLLQEYDRALLGGRTPHELPDLMRDRSPINFVENVRAPVLVLAGENDSRCPIRQVRNYVERLEALRKPHETYFFSTGHGSFDVDERVRQQRVILEFLGRHVAGR